MGEGKHRLLVPYRFSQGAIIKLDLRSIILTTNPPAALLIFF
jgi:hypothetical protein